MIQLAEVTVSVLRREAPVLNGITIEVEAGERVIILGPSGSGKSSLLRVISGVIPHSVNADLAGQVRVAGVDSHDTTVVDRARIVGAVGQDPAASVCLASVEDEVALPLENLAVPREEISGRLDDALALVNASGLRHRRTGELSGGETQRIALAATMAMQPTILLLDEPTSMLDPAGVAAVRKAVDSAVVGQNPTVLLVEHRLDEFAGREGIAGLPGRAIALNDEGRIVADGPTEEVFNDHAAALHAAGCWLPLAAELHAITGHPGGLSNQQVVAQLHRLSDPKAEQRAAIVAGPRPQATVLEAQALTVGRDDGSLLAGLDLTLRAGEVVALLGPNGIGKTSLLLTLAGLLPPQEGAIIGPRPGMVFQHPELQFLAHRVCDEIAVGLPRRMASERVAEAMRNHRLEHVASQSPFRCSGGEQRRLSLAAMLAHQDRPVLLADEPTFGLDRRDALQAAATMRAAASGGRSVLCSTHDLRFAATIADRVIVLGATATRAPAGRVVAQGPTLEVLADPEVRRAAGLVLPELLDFLLDEFGPTDAVVRTLRGLAGW